MHPINKDFDMLFNKISYNLTSGEDSKKKKERKKKKKRWPEMADFSP